MHFVQQCGTAAEGIYLFVEQNTETVCITQCLSTEKRQHHRKRIYVNTSIE